MGIEISVDISGPIADGLNYPVIRDYAEHLEEVLGERGVSMIRAYLPTQYMYLGHHGGDPQHNPVPPGAGELAASIHTERSTTDHTIIVGDTVIYGPWIEGVAVGNTFFWPGRVRRGLSPRFEGYHTFRVITGVLNDIATELAYTELPRYIDELNA